MIVCKQDGDTYYYVLKLTKQFKISASKSSLKLLPILSHESVKLLRDAYDAVNHHFGKKATILLNKCDQVEKAFFFLRNLHKNHFSTGNVEKVLKHERYG